MPLLLVCLLTIAPASVAARDTPTTGDAYAPIDPSTPLEDRDVSRLGTGLWNRVLFDATRSWKFERRPEWGGDRFPPTVRPAPGSSTCLSTSTRSTPRSRPVSERR